MQLIESLNLLPDHDALMTTVPACFQASFVKRVQSLLIAL